VTYTFSRLALLFFPALTKLKSISMKNPPYKPRQFVPTEIDLTEIAQLEPLFARLKTGLQAVKSVADLEAWLQNQSEVSAALDQSRAIKYIEMTCQTDDPAREMAYLKIIETVEPWLKPRQFELLQILVSNPWLKQLPAEYAVFARSVEVRVKLYREENVARETEEAKLSQKYQKMIGAMTVTFDGKEQTLPQMSRYLEEANRSRRQAAWEAIGRRRLQDREQLDEIYETMLGLREQIAKAADYPDYRAYTFANYERFDYTPDDCLKLHQAIEKRIVPLARLLQEERKAKLKVDQLRPWDLAVDPEQRPPLRPFAKADELVSKSEKIFRKLDGRLAGFFGLLREFQLVDLENRKGKAPGGYQSTLAEARLPFIFMNAVGMQRDVETLVHEAGHAFHAVAARDQKIHAYRSSPIEFAEVASMSMELLTAPYWNEFYSDADAKRARHDHLEGIIKLFPWIATVDAFQHWIYTHPGHTRKQREECWVDLIKRFGGIEDWTGYEANRASMWHRQLHIFEIPFYYVEYGIAQLGALQLWRQARQNPKKAIDAYLKGLSLGGSRPLPELFTAAGISFDFSDEIIAPLTAEVRETLMAEK